MASFFIPAFLLLALVLLLLLRPFIFSGKGEGTSRRQMNAAIYREELEKLAAEHAAGTIDAQEYEISHAEMRQLKLELVFRSDSHNKAKPQNLQELPPPIAGLGEGAPELSWSSGATGGSQNRAGNACHFIG